MINMKSCSYTIKESKSGDKEWFVNSLRHRVDGPAIERVNGSKHWYIYGVRHRVDGPAIERVNGYKEWWVNGQKLTEEEFNKHTKPLIGAQITINGIEYALN